MASAQSRSWTRTAAGSALLTLVLLLRFPAVDGGSCSPDNPLKRMVPCNGHGECNTLYGICVCDFGWSGFNCSIPDTPCSGKVERAVLVSARVILEGHIQVALTSARPIGTNHADKTGRTLGLLHGWVLRDKLPKLGHLRLVKTLILSPCSCCTLE